MTKTALKGCRPMPLASYLEALGVVRLVAEQADSTIKAYWRDDTFLIDSALTADDLVDFFMNKYAPTPIVAPWNGGSGFYQGDAREGMTAILDTTDERFSLYRKVVDDIRSWEEIPRDFQIVADVICKLEEVVRESNAAKTREKYSKMIAKIHTKMDAAKDVFAGNASQKTTLSDLESSTKQLKGGQKKTVKAWWDSVRTARTEWLTLERKRIKGQVLAACRSRLPDECLDWLDATVVMRNDGEPSYNPLLGSGGNEGRLDFSNNFMQRLGELLISGDRDRTEGLLRSAIFGETRAGLSQAKIGQYDPGRAGGYNQGSGVETKDFKINPWDFVLMLEGASVLSSAVTRRSNTESRGNGASPFTVSFSGVGFTSSQRDEDARAETWLPTWSQPADFRELKYLFGEGRSTIGRRPSQNGLDFTRSLGSLGVDRGVDGFVRYAFIKRRGESYVALPAGRLPVRFKPELRLLDDLDPLLSRVDGFLRAFKNVPATFQSARRNIDDAIFECCETPDSYRFSTLVRALGTMEQLIAQRDRSKKPMLASPLGGLRPEWIVHCDDGGPEVRIATALASIRSTGKVGSIRSNIAGVDAANPWGWAVGSGQKRWHGSNLVERLGVVLIQRLMDAERLSAPMVPIQGRVTLSPYDVVSFLYGDTDDRLVEELLWGFSLVTWRNDAAAPLRDRWSYPVERRPLPRSWALMKLVHMPGKIRGEVVRMEPRIATLLLAGNVDTAAEIAHRRLRVSRLKPIEARYEEWIEPRRLLAAMLLPTKRGQLESLVLEEE